MWFRREAFQYNFVVFATLEGKHFVDIEPHTDYLKKKTVVKNSERILAWHHVSIIPVKK